MKNISIVFIALFLFFISCDDKENENASRTVDQDTSSAINRQPGQVSDIGGCYVMIQGKDTATLDLVVAGLKVSGNLQYRRFEKDNNTGTMSGTLRDSLKESA